MKYKITTLSNQCFGLGHYASNETNDQIGTGKIFIPVSTADGGYALYSEDNGKTFVRLEAGVRLDNGVCLEPNKNRKNVPFVRLADGTFMAMNFENAAYDLLFNTEQEKIPYCAAVYRAASIDDIIAGKVDTSIVLIDIPGLSCGYGDSGNGSAGTVDYLYQMSNGDIIAMMYGQFKDDKILCPYFDQNCGYKFYLYRVWTVVSHDMGHTWEFGTTVADCNTYPIADINAEGYCEPYCLEVEPGHLCAILRTGGHEVVSPLYCTHSYDYGKTWEAPYEICSWGVLPKLLLMENGTLVCVSGHEHNFLMFSDDLGKTWGEPYIIEECYGKWGNSPSGYNTIVESAPGEITMIYDDPKEMIAQNAPDGYKRQIYVRTLRIEKVL